MRTRILDGVTQLIGVCCPVPQGNVDLVKEVTGLGPLEVSLVGISGLYEPEIRELIEWQVIIELQGLEMLVGPTYIKETVPYSYAVIHQPRLVNVIGDNAIVGCVEIEPQRPGQVVVQGVLPVKEVIALEQFRQTNVSGQGVQLAELLLGILTGNVGAHRNTGRQIIEIEVF